LSMKVGELKLFPALRQLGTSPKSEGFGGGWEGVVSSGAACRMQIKQGTGVDAIHPIVLIANRMREVIAHDKK